MQGALILLAAIFVSPLGYLLIGPLGALTDRAAGSPVLSRIRIVERTGSTNADLIADRSAAEGEWLIALTQEAGKGRQGRAWVSAAGQFLREHLRPAGRRRPAAHSLSLAAGLALAEAIDGAVPGQSLMLKWPNDLMLLGKKLAGILLERSGDRVVVGFGVNLASAPELPDRKGASLGGAITPQAFAPLLAASFARLLGLWRSKRAGVPRPGLACPRPSIGTRLTVHAGPDDTLSGRFDGLEPDGALRLRRDDGSLDIVRAGDVEL